jgi:hypothetical protein
MDSFKLKENWSEVVCKLKLKYSSLIEEAVLTKSQGPATPITINQLNKFGTSSLSRNPVMYISNRFN